MPEAVRARLVGLGGGVPGAHWVEDENLHLTLRFIGEIESGLLPEIDAVLDRVATPGFTLTLSGVGCFGHGHKAHSLWVGVTANPALELLQGRIESALGRAGLPPEPRKFTAHVTLARLKNAPPERLYRFLAANNLFQSQPIAVDRFQLYQSHLGRSGPCYQPLASYPLSPPPLATALIHALPDSGN